jgi:hypothetical protein
MVKRKSNKRSRSKKQCTKKRCRGGRGGRGGRSSRHTKKSKQYRMRGGYKEGEKYYMYSSEMSEPVILTIVTTNSGRWQNIILVDENDNEYNYNDSRLTALIERADNMYPHIRVM